MTPKQIKRELMLINPEAIYANGFEKALIGYTVNSFRNNVAVYSSEKCIKILMKQGISESEAIEHIEFNTLSAYVGPNTPLFIRG